MAVIANSQTRIVNIHPQSPSSPSESGNDDFGASCDDCEPLQDTVAFDEFEDSVVRLESSFVDTELVDDLDFAENVMIPTFEYEDDVVLDSEDEEINCSRVIRVSSTLSGNETEMEVKSDAQEVNLALEFHSSDQKQCDTGEQVSSNCYNGVDMGKDSSQHPESLSYCSSQEPGESTQVNALGFVDHFVTINTANVNPSQGIGHRKAPRVQSPLLSRIKGPQSLAKRLGRKLIEETGSFEWVDTHNQEAKCNSFGNCKKATSGFSNCRGQSYATKPQVIAKPSNTGDCLLKKNESEEANVGIRFQSEEVNAIEATASTLPHPRLRWTDGMSTIEIENKSNKESNAEVVEEQLECMDDEGDGLDLLDIGFNTQIAAEAMEALANNIPDSNNLVIACNPETSLNNVSCCMREYKPHLSNSHPQIIGGTVRKSKRTQQSKRKLNAKCSNTSPAQHDCQELESILTTKRKAKRSRLAVQGQLNYTNSPDESNYSATSSNLLSDAGSCQLSQLGLNNEDLVTITGSIVGLWRHSRRSRTPRNFQSHPNISGKQNTFLAVEGKCHSSISILKKKGTKIRGNQETKKLISVLSSYPRRHSSRFKSDRYSSEQVYDKSGSTGRNHKRKNTSKPPSKELARLGVSELVPDLRWKDLRRRRTMALVKVCFSQHLDEATLKQQKKVVLQLGISIESSSSNATHFVADKFVRTRNMLEAIALGKPVVTHSWLESCGQASCFIDEKNYILRDIKKEKDIGFKLPISLSRATQNPLLKGIRVLVTSNIKPDKEIITNLVKMSQGETTKMSEIFTGKDEKIPDDLLILSCEEDYAKCVPFIRKGATVYSSELLLNGIVIQKLERKRHRLFTDRTKDFDDNQDQ